MNRKNAEAGAARFGYWRLALVAGMASYLDAGLIVCGGVALSIWQRHFGLDSFQLGIISGVLTLGIAVGALVGGRLADVFGRRRVFNIDVFLYVIGVTVIVFAPSSEWLLVGVAVAGLAAGADLPTSLAVVSEYAPDAMRGRLIAFTQVMWTIGILASTLLGFLVSGKDYLGIQFLFAHLAILGALTWLVRVCSSSIRRLESQANAARVVDEQSALPWKALFSSKPMVRTIVLTCGFYVAWNVMANTIGQFKIFFLVAVSGASQSLATALAIPTSILAVTGGIIFVKIADTKYRRPLFYTGAVLQVVAMTIAALNGGAHVFIMAMCFALYSMSYPFAGEALYKVWTQEQFPTNARSTVQGLTYAISRFVCAGFAVVSPAIVSSNPVLLLWVLAGCAAVSGLIGSKLIGTSSPSMSALKTPAFQKR